MTDGRRPHWVWGLFLEYLVAGIATAAGEAIVTETVKAVKKRQKRKKKQKDPPEQAGC